MNKEEATFWATVGSDEFAREEGYGDVEFDSFDEAWEWYLRNKDGGYLKRIEKIRKDLEFAEQSKVCYACGSDKNHMWSGPHEYRYLCIECRKVLKK